MFRLAVTVAVAASLGAAATVAVQHIGRNGTGGTPAARPTPTPTPPGTWWTYKMPSQGAPTSAAQLADYATRAAALAPLFPVPGPSEWYYTERLGPVGEEGKCGCVLTGKRVVQHWQQVDSNHAADSIQYGKLSFSSEGTADAGLAK